METFDTTQTARRDRVAMWNAVTAATFGDIAICPEGDDLEARMIRRSSGTVGLASVLSSPAQVRGAAGSRDRRGGHFLLLNERGVSEVEQAGGRVTLAPGRLTAIEADKPYLIEFHDQNHMIVAHVPDVARGVTVTALDDRDDDALLAALLRRWADDPSELGSEQGTYARLVRDLMLISSSPSPAAPTHVRAEWMRQIEEYVTAHLADDDLSAESVGRALGTSRRYVQLIVAEQGTTFSRLVLERRLALAAERLRADPGSSITTVAFESGFNDLSHFCRTFKTEFQCSASAWRRLR